MMKKIVSYIALLLAATIVAACGSTTYEQRGLETLHHSAIHGLTQKPSTNNCPVTSFDVAGEGWRMNGTGWRMNGTTGGLFVDAGAQFSASRPSDVAFSNFGASKNIGIIVLDQFSYAPDGEDGERIYAFELDESINSLVDAANQGDDELKVAMENLRRSGKLSHGALVLSHIHALLDGTPETSYLGKRRLSDRASAYVFERQDTSVLVLALDVTDLNTDLIVPSLNAAATYMLAMGFTNYAVNMSFSLVPCQVLNNARAEGFDTLGEYLAALPGDLTTDEKINLLSSDAFVDRQGDPLLQRIRRGLQPDSDTPLPVPENLVEVFVSAAGNYSGDYPLYPALADNVISVSSTNLPNYKLSSFTNNGEVAAPGFLFSLDDPVSGLSNDKIAYAGTSFAAPAVTVYSALDMGQAEPECFDTSTPPSFLTRLYTNRSLLFATYLCNRTFEPPTVPIPEPKLP